MNNLPKLECVICDLDGSLLNSQKKVSPQDLETIKTLKSMVHDGIRLTDDSTSFINRSDLEEALAAAAKISHLQA